MPSGVPQRGREKPPVESPLRAARCQVGSSGQWPGPLAAMSPEHQSAAEESWGPGQRNRLVVLMGLGDAPQWALSFLPVTSCRARALSQRCWGSALTVAVVRRDPPPPRVTAQAPLRPDQKHAVTHVREVRFENMKLPFRIFKSSRFSLIQ